MLQKISQFNIVKFSLANLKSAENLKQTLKKGIPIGSMRQHTDGEVLDALSQLTSESPVQKTRDAFALLREVPTSVAEVLSAGWIAASEDKTALLSEAFSNYQGEKIFEFMKKALNDRDNLLMKSIEILSVMRKVPSVTE